MYSASILWISSSFSLLLGLLIGVMAAKNLSSQAQKTKELENKLSAAEKSLAQYREQVVDHFSKTSDLVNKLTDTYKEVHDHLRISAVQLCNDEFSRHLLSILPPKSASRSSNSTARTAPDHSTHIEPPKDYAPKTDPSAKGALNEEYGLEKIDYLDPLAETEVEEKVN